MGPVNLGFIDDPIQVEAMAKARPISNEALELHRSAVVIDLHADTLSLMRMGYDIFKRHHPFLPRAAFGFHVDLPRMDAGGLTAQVFGLVTSPLGRKGLFESACRQMELLRKAASVRPERLRFVTEADEIEQAKVDGVAAGLCGLEGAHALEGKMENMKALAERGLRYLGLVHFTANPAGRPAQGLGRSMTVGLTDFGRSLVEACNRLGVVVDLAHLNRPGFMEAAELSTDPVIVSHTGLSAVHRLWRNIDDEQIQAVADTGGCIGIIFSGYYLGGSRIDALVDHLLHCLKKGGEDCPALGSDFDGLIVPPRDLRDVSELPWITEALLRKGVEERVILKILGGNVLRVFRSVPARACCAGGVPDA